MIDYNNLVNRYRNKNINNTKYTNVFQDRYTTQQLLELVIDNKLNDFEGRDLTVHLKHQWEVHLKGINLECIFKSKFPSEPPEIIKWRMENLQLITKSILDRVLNCLTNIKTDKDYSIDYLNDISMEYCTNEYPYYDDINHHFWDIYKNCIYDPNGVLAILPFDFFNFMITPKKNLSQPYLYFFSSDEVLYKDGYNFLIQLTSNDKLFITPLGIYHITTINETPQVFLKLEYNFNGFTPAFTVTGNWIETINNIPIYESYLTPALPFLNDALSIYSDLKVVEKNHAYPLLWIYNDKKCGTCNGVGNISVPNDSGGVENIRCKSCVGSGYETSPAYYLEINPTSSLNSDKIPSPPGGYITRDIDPMVYLKDQVDANLNKALASLHMEFLNVTIYDQSGISKSFDRMEYELFLKRITYTFTQEVMTPAFYYINSFLGIDARKVVENIPNINLPGSFYPSIDLYNSSNISNMAQYLNGPMLNNLILKYSSNEFNKIENDLHSIFIDLDPLVSLKLEDKLNLLERGLITEDDMLISLNIKDLIYIIIDPLSVDNVEEFNTLPYTVKKDLLLKEMLNMKSKLSKSIFTIPETEIVEETIETEKNDI